MPKLPSFKQLGDAPPIRPQGAIPHYSAAGFVGNTGEGLQKLGAGLMQAGLTLKNRSGTLEGAQADADFQTREMRLRSELGQDPDYETAPGRYQQGANRIVEESSANISDPNRRELFRQRHRASVERGSLAIEENATRQRRDAVIADTASRLDALNESALSATDETERGRIIASGNDLVNGMAEAGFITRTQAQAQRKAWTERYALASIQAMPPSAQLELLNRHDEATRPAEGASSGAEPGGLINAVKRFEGYAPKAQWDYKQYSIGYGTKGTAGETVDRATAEVRLRQELDKASGIVDNAVPNLPAGARDAMISLTYNAGGSWANGRLGDLLRAGDFDGAKAAFVQYNKAGGKVLPGLQARRAEEVKWFDSGGAGGSATEPARSGTILDFIPVEKRQVLRRNAEAKAWEYNAKENIEVDNLIESSLSQTRNTGEDTPVDPERIARAFGVQGPTKAAQYVEQREINRRLWDATAGMETMTATQIQERVRGLQPADGDPDYARRASVAEATQKHADALLKLRTTDPAAAAAQLPAVREAYQAVNQNDPASRKRAIDAAMAAQEAMGIPEQMRSPITRAEAVELGTSLSRVLPGQERQAMTEIGQTVQERYGEHADRAFEFVLSTQRVNAETARIAGRVMRRLQLGENPTREDMRAIDNSEDVDASNRAMNAADEADQAQAARDAAAAAGRARSGVRNVQRPASPAPEAAPVEAKPVPPAADIRALMANPNLAERFDEKWGKGTAAKLMKTYGPR